MAFATGQYADGDTASSTSISATLNGVSAGATLIFMAGTGFVRTFNAPTPSANSETWDARSEEATSGIGRVKIWVAENVSAGNYTVTANIAGAAYSITCVIMEFSGRSTTSFDIQNSNTNTPATTTHTTGSANNTTEDGCDTVGVAGVSGNPNNYTSDQTEAGTRAWLISQYAENVSAGANAISGTTSDSQQSVMAMVALKQAAAGGGMKRRYPMMLTGVQ